MTKCNTCSEKIVGVSFKLCGRDEESYTEFCSELCRGRFPFQYKRTGTKNRPLKRVD